jgi:hypothetical protein
MFTVTKKDQTLRSIADLREVNKRIQRSNLKDPRITTPTQRVSTCNFFGFEHGILPHQTYSQCLSHYFFPNTSAICTVILPWGKYEYLRLPIGLCNSLDIFQEMMSDLMQGLEFTPAYIDNLLILSTGSFSQHLEHLDKVFSRLNECGLKINAAKSFFARTQLEYLGYWLTRDGVMPLNKKVEAINNLAPPTNCTEVRKFIGLVHCYRDMRKQRSEILAPLTKLMSTKKTWKWTDKQQNAFGTMKKIMAREAILAHPNFENLSKYTLMQASAYQLGAVISKNRKPIAFYPKKLTPTQTRYTTTERELLSIVETLKEFRTILLGQQLVVHTDHENLTYKHFNSDRVMRWRLYIEECSPDLRYIKRTKNVAADALSRLGILNSPMNEAHFTEALCSKLYAFDDKDLTATAFPLSYAFIGKAQSTDVAILNETAKTKLLYSIQPFTGGGKTQ